MKLIIASSALKQGRLACFICFKTNESCCGANASHLCFGKVVRTLDLCVPEGVLISFFLNGTDAQDVSSPEHLRLHTVQ
jgi:hypothetical protein